MPETAHFEEDDGVCTITIENSGKRNAISPSIAREVTGRIDALRDRDDDVVLVLRGAGETAFSAGFDISHLGGDSRAGREAFYEMVDAVGEYEYPTIAMVNGMAVGGGFALMLSCDLRVAVDHARFGIPPARLGHIYPSEAIEACVDAIGPANTKELLFTAELIDAERAVGMGLFPELVDADDLEDRTHDLARSIAKNAPLSIKGMKRIVDAVAEKSSLSTYENEWVERLRDEAYASRDHREGVAAFAEDREPEFEGR